MKFEDIAFYERSGSDNHELGRHIRGYWVSKKYLEIAWKNALVEFPKLDWLKPQTTESLCGKATWDSCGNSTHIRLGRCMKYFADQEVLPIQVANPGKKGKKKYARAN